MVQDGTGNARSDGIESFPKEQKQVLLILLAQESLALSYRANLDGIPRSLSPDHVPKYRFNQCALLRKSADLPRFYVL